MSRSRIRSGAEEADYKDSDCRGMGVLICGMRAGRAGEFHAARLEANVEHGGDHDEDR